MINKTIIRLIKIYQTYISARLGRQCCFKPTCSNYAVLALKKNRTIRAIILIVGRLHRCSRFSQGEYSYIDYP